MSKFKRPKSPFQDLRGLTNYHRMFDHTEYLTVLVYEIFVTKENGNFCGKKNKKIKERRNTTEQDFILVKAVIHTPE